MVSKLKSQEDIDVEEETDEIETFKRAFLDIQEIEDVCKNGLEQFVSSQSKDFFTQFD